VEERSQELEEEVADLENQVSEAVNLIGKAQGDVVKIKSLMHSTDHDLKNTTLEIKRLKQA